MHKLVFNEHETRPTLAHMKTQLAKSQQIPEDLDEATVFLRLTAPHSRPHLRMPSAVKTEPGFKSSLKEQVHSLKRLHAVHSFSVNWKWYKRKRLQINGDPQQTHGTRGRFMHAEVQAQIHNTAWPIKLENARFYKKRCRCYAPSHLAAEISNPGPPFSTHSISEIVHCI